MEGRNRTNVSGITIPRFAIKLHPPWLTPFSRMGLLWIEHRSHDSKSRVLPLYYNPENNLKLIIKNGPTANRTQIFPLQTENNEPLYYRPFIKNVVENALLPRAVAHSEKYLNAKLNWIFYYFYYLILSYYLVMNIANEWVEHSPQAHEACILPLY